jgi:uncharacterized membrane protein
MGIRGFLTTLGLGLGAMYFMDPDQGNRRRSLIRDQFVSLGNDAQEVWEKGSEDLANRAKGLQYKATKAPSDVMQAGKDALSGNRGSMNLSNMNLGSTNFGMDMDKPGDRLLTMSGGGLLALYGLVRGGILGKVALLAGANYVAKGLTRKDVLGDAVTKMRGSSMGGGIEFRKGIRINAPVDEVFAFWQNYDNFPRFMSHLKEVRDMGNGRSHWVANGPAGTPVEWDAQITEMRPNRVIAWESMPGSEVYNAGRVRFQPEDGTTRIDVFMTYNPPGGVAGHAVAALFGSDPKSAMDDDLLKLKSLLEQGGTESMRPGYSYRQSGGGNSGMDTLDDEISGGSLSGGESAPRQRKPGGETPGAGS